MTWITYFFDYDIISCIRLNLLEAHNSLFNYDIISLWETTKLSYLTLFDWIYWKRIILCSTMILYPFVTHLNSLTKQTLFDWIYLKHIILCSTMILYLFVKQLNSLTKDNFIRLNLLEAHNSLFNYDIISLCETTKALFVQLTKDNFN